MKCLWFLALLLSTAGAAAQSTPSGKVGVTVQSITYNGRVAAIHLLNTSGKPITAYANEALTAEGKLLSSDSLKQMFTEYPEATHEGQHYGYGVVISRLKFGRLLYYHGGGVEGFSSSIPRYPNDQVCIAILSNLDSYKPWELGDHIASDLFSRPLSAAR